VTASGDVALTLSEPGGTHARHKDVAAAREGPMAQAITIHMGVLLGMLLAAAVFGAFA
jgi:hypothetical protein